MSPGTMVGSSKHSGPFESHLFFTRGTFVPYVDVLVWFGEGVELLQSVTRYLVTSCSGIL